MDLQDPILKNSSTQNDAPVPANPEDSNVRPCSRSNKRKILKYILIVTAVCIALTGIFFAWLCIDFHPHKSLEEMGAVSFPVEGYSGMASNLIGHPFTFSLEEDIPLKWAVKVDSGSFLIDRYDHYYDKREYVIDNGQKIYWNQHSAPSFTIEKTDQIYIEAILYAESHIVGYCVIELHVITYGGSSKAEILDSAYYPPQDGEYQNITMAHIRKQILKAKILG